MQNNFNVYIDYKCKVWVEWNGKSCCMHFLEKQNTSPAQPIYPNLQSSSENVIYNNISFHFCSAKLKVTLSSQLPLQ